MDDNAYQLVVRKGPRPGQIFSLALDTMAIGRDPSSDIVINDAEVSRHHARLTISDDGYQLQDLGSTNGSFVGGRRLSGEPVLLSPGQIIMLGTNVTMVYQMTTEVDPMATVVAPADMLPDLAEEEPVEPVEPVAMPEPEPESEPPLFEPEEEAFIFEDVAGEEEVDAELEYEEPGEDLVEAEEEAIAEDLLFADEIVELVEAEEIEEEEVEAELTGPEEPEEFELVFDEPDSFEGEIEEKEEPDLATVMEAPVVVPPEPEAEPEAEPFPSFEPSEPELESEPEPFPSFEPSEPEPEPFPAYEEPVVAPAVDEVPEYQPVRHQPPSFEAPIDSAEPVQDFEPEKPVEAAIDKPPPPPVPPPSGEPKKSGIDRRLIIAVVAILLLCCCLVIIVLAVLSATGTLGVIVPRAIMSLLPLLGGI